jgi:hypothetical protein
MVFTYFDRMFRNMDRPTTSSSFRRWAAIYVLECALSVCMSLGKVVELTLELAVILVVAGVRLVVGIGVLILLVLSLVIDGCLIYH